MKDSSRFKVPVLAQRGQGLPSGALAGGSRFVKSSIKNRKPSNIDTTGDGKIGNNEMRTGKNGAFFAALCSSIIAILIFFCVTALAQTQTPAKKPVQSSQTPIEKRIGDLEKDVLKLDRQVNMYNLDALPDFLMLCDKKVPIFRDDVRERFERELFLILENKGLLTTIVKRYFKHLPMINEEIQKQSLPSDLIFLAVAESYLNPRSVSSASAAGMWQFIKETGKREGLTISDDIDERYNVKKSTQSALTHLKRLYGEFNDWFIAMAAYNAGPARLKEVIENQNTRDFFDMYLPEETERYLFRIIALKETILNMGRYGIDISEQEFYKPLMLTEVTLETEREIHSNILAQAMEVSYRTFRINNLHIRKYKIPKGLYRINIPVEKRSLFIKNLKNYDYIKVF
jgi:membrane-bound lytic murein transglycosylase D